MFIYNDTDDCTHKTNIITITQAVQYSDIFIISLLKGLIILLNMTPTQVNQSLKK